MMLRDWNKTAGMRAAVGMFAVALLVTLWTLVRAFRSDAAPPSSVVAMSNFGTIERGATPLPADVDAAVDGDIFSPGRTAPSVPYRMPGEGSPDDASKVQADKPAVLGTVVATDGRHLATVQLGTGHPTLVHVGDKIGEWVVRSIERGKVAFVGAGGTRIDVTVPKPGI